MNIRVTIAALIVCGLVGLAERTQQALQAAERPNIVFIFTDDHWPPHA